MNTMICKWLCTDTKSVKSQDYFSGKIFISQNISIDLQTINYGQKFDGGKNKYDSRPYKAYGHVW